MKATTKYIKRLLDQNRRLQDFDLDAYKGEPKHFENIATTFDLYSPPPYEKACLPERRQVEIIVFSG